jgi:hypothetical protein
MTELTWQEIDSWPEPDPQPCLTDRDFRGCRHIAGEASPLRSGMYCCKPTAGVTLPWCAEHLRVVARVPGRRAPGTMAQADLSVTLRRQ